MENYAWITLQGTARSDLGKDMLKCGPEEDGRKLYLESVDTTEDARDDLEGDVEDNAGEAEDFVDEEDDVEVEGDND